MPNLSLPKPFEATAIYDLSQSYSSFVPFTANSAYPVHRWYRFKEGFSRDLVHLIFGSLGGNIRVCLDPFGGSGTTALTCQYLGLKCYSIEVNPFLHHVSQVKLSTRYTETGFENSMRRVRRTISRELVKKFPIPPMSTITRRAHVDQWLFSRAVLHGISALRSSFSLLPPSYEKLFIVILASILPEVGNTFKDGKCVRYKKDWRHRKLSAYHVVDLFLKQCDIFREDISYITEHKESAFKNRPFCFQGTALESLRHLKSNSVDTVITSPPYLNSFDYTDVYMPELWALGFVEDYDDVKRLRERTLRSHVQVKWQVKRTETGPTISRLVREVVGNGAANWNNGIPDMIAGYFLDLRQVLLQLSRIIKPNGNLCIVVGTSSYNGVVIPTDLILAGIARDLGFVFEEMRIARNLKASTKQRSRTRLPGLRESILIFSRSRKNVTSPSLSFAFPKSLI